MNPSEEGPEVLLEVEVCIPKGGGADQGQGAATDLGRNQLLLGAGETPAANVPDQGVESVSAEPVLLREIVSSRDLPAGGFC